MKRSNVYTLLGCFLAISLGAAAGGLRRSDSPEAATRPKSAERRPLQTAAVIPDQVQIDERLAQALNTRTGAKRWLVMFSALENATSFDMPGLIRAAGDDRAMLRILATRWAELDPQGMLHSIHADYLLPEGSPAALPSRWILTDALFSSWTAKDPGAVVETVGKMPEFPGLDSLRMTVVNYLMKADAEKGLLAMKDWNIRHYLPDMKGVEEWAAREPRRAAEMLAQFHGNSAGQGALKVVGKSWALSDPQAALQFAASLTPEQRGAMATGVMQAWADRDLNAAIAAATAEPDLLFRAALAPGLIAPWAKADPAAALAWSQDQLRGVARTEVIAGIIKAAAEKDLQTASELVADMQPGPVQIGACASIFEAWFNKGVDQRSAAFEWLASLPDAAAREAALEKVQWNWTWKEPEAVRDFIAGPFGNMASNAMVHQVARNETARNPEEAMKWAKQLPSDRAYEAKQVVLGQWLEVRPEGAMEYARGLPAGVERNRAIQTISQNLVHRSPAQAAKWYHKLSRAEQQALRDMVLRSGISDDHRRQLDEAFRTP